MGWRTETTPLTLSLPVLPAALAVDAAGSLGAFGNFDGRLKVVWKVDLGVTTWTDIGAAIAGAPVAAKSTDGRIGVFYRDPDNRLMCLAQNADKSTWAVPVHLSGALLKGDPVVGVNG